MRLMTLISGAVCTLFTLYFAFTCLGGVILRKARQIPSRRPTRRIAAVIAARNESAVIGQLIASLMAQDYPRRLFDVYVLANNCTDDTAAVAEAAGAVVLPCDVPIRSKGDALRCAFGQLTAMGRYDAYCVFDADNLADPQFFRAVNDAREAGYHVAQGYRDSKNPYDSWLSGSMSVFYWFMSRFYNESRARLNMSASLNGTGFMVSDEAIRAFGWGTHSLTEDLEFTALCALHGYKVGWMPGARTYDEQTLRFWDSCVQRRRWTAGSLQCMKRYVPALLKKRTAASLDMALLFMGNLLCIVGLLPAIGTVAELAPVFRAHPERLGPTILLGLGVGILYYLACAGAATLMFKLEGRLNRRCLPAIFGFPIFMVSWMPVNLVACLTPPPKWKEIVHTRGLDAPQTDARGGN